jgi:hypothetical protein
VKPGIERSIGHFTAEKQWNVVDSRGMNTSKLATLLAIAMLGIPTLSLAQTERGTITGVVMDSTKAAVPGVSVKVINTGTTVATNVVSSESGSYSAANLVPGTYRIEATLQGFQTSNVDGVIVNAGTTARVDVTLNLGSVTESVDVVAATATVQTEDAKVATTVSNRLIDELPLVVGGAMRSPFDLLATVPEARGSGNTTSLGGGQGGSFGATLDGVSVNTNRQADTNETAFLTPSLEAITEFQVETNGFKPEFGQAGGGSITFASKSGTNVLQGSGYGFFRHDALDRKGFFERQKGIYKQSDFGGALGGPVHIPNVYSGRNRTFFFASYEGFYNNQGSNATFRSVPTPEMWNGDFSNWVNASGQRITIYDPATTRPNPNGTGFIRDPFPGNRIPQERFSNVAKQYIAMARSVLAPNRSEAVPGTFAYVNNNYVSEGASTIERTNKYSLKIDHTLSNTHRVAYLFNRTVKSLKPGANGSPGLPAPFSDFQTDNFDGDLHRASWDWVGAQMVNHLTVGANTFNKIAFSPNVDQNWKDKVCIPNVIDCNQNMGAVQFTEFSTWGAVSYNGTKQPRFTVKDDVTFIKGSHTIKTGFTFDRQQANGFGQQDYGGRARFSFLQTGVPGVTNFANAGGSSFASFLLGYANEGRTETIRFLQQIYPYYGFYAQDDWRINEKLVFNYGLRYEFTRPPVAGGDQYSELDPTKPNPAVNGYPGALIFAGEGPGREGKRSLIPGYYGAVAPRLSAAYSLNDKTTVRAGVGRSFGRVTVISGTSHFAGYIGQYEFLNGDSGVTPTFLLDQGLPSYPLPPQLNPSFSNNQAVDYWNGRETMKPATYDTWTISMQREVLRGMTVEVDYNGSKGSNLQANLLSLNQVPLSVVNDLISRFGAAGAVALLNSPITSPAAVAAGIRPPYANFTNPAVQTTRSVAQALRPFPQYGNINTSVSGGDKTGRSMYHAGVLKVTQRLSEGFLFQGSYTYSKLMTNADTFSGSTGSMDTAQPDLEYTVGRLDQPHSIRLNTVYELPWGEGRRWLNSGVASKVIGGWRIAAVQTYNSGLPIRVTTSAAPLPIFNGTNRPNVTGVDWRAPIAGDEFNPLVDRYLNRLAFSAPVGQLGNAPRVNGSVRRPWNLTENVSLAKTISMTSQVRLDVRMEAFNIFNRVIWGEPEQNFNNNNFGLITSQGNSPRQMQFGLKLYW